MGFANKLGPALAAVWLCVASLQAGSLDPSFAPEFFGSASIRDVLAHPTGKVYVSGTLLKADGIRNPGNFVRLNADGSLDTTFKLGSTIDGTVSRILLLNDQRICILGSFTRVAGQSRNHIAVLTKDGALDYSFKPQNNVPGTPTFALRQPDGRFLVTCSDYMKSVYQNGQWVLTYPKILVRLLYDGNIDPKFKQPTAGLSSPYGEPDYYQEVGAHFVSQQPDGKLLIGGNFHLVDGVARNYLARLQPVGSLDNSFDSPLIDAHEPPYREYLSSSGVFAGQAFPDGSVVIGGSFKLAADPSQQAIVRLRPKGDVDPGFRVDLNFPYDPFQTPSVTHIEADQFGRMAILGSFDFLEGEWSSGAAFIDPSGHSTGPTDLPFGGLRAVSMRTDGYCIFGRTGSATSKGILQPSLLACKPNGSQDDLFAARLLGASRPTSVGIRPHRGVIVGGSWFDEIGETKFPGLAALTGNGSVASDFHCVVEPPNTVNFILPLPEGRFLIGGDFSRINGMRAPRLAVVGYDGHPSRTFLEDEAPDGALTAAALLPNGKILIAGYFSKVGNFSTRNLAVIDLSTSWASVDTSFKIDMTDLYGVSCVAGLNDGKILIGGWFWNLGGTGIRGLARLNADGSLDESFNLFSAYQHASVEALALDSAGRVVVGGTFSPMAAPIRRLLRFFADGTPDPSLNESAIGWVRSIVMQSDNRMIVQGSFSSNSGLKGRQIGRLFETGEVDLSLDLPNLNGVDGLALSPPEQLYVWGNFTAVGDEPRMGMALFNLHEPVPPIISVYPSRPRVQWGEEIVLEVISSGIDETYAWSKDGVPLQGKTGHGLRIESATAKDAGSYVVTATNFAGNTMAASVLAVEGSPPPAPTPTPTPTPPRIPITTPLPIPGSKLDPQGAAIQKKIDTLKRQFVKARKIPSAAARANRLKRIKAQIARLRKVARRGD